MTVRRATLAATVLLGSALPLVAPTALAAAAAVGSLCAPPADTVAPVVTQVTFGKPSIDLNTGSRVQTVTATASDSSGNGDPSGVAHVSLEVRGNRSFNFARLKLTSGTPASGEWTGQFEVSKYAHPGTYSIEDLTATDADRNTQEYPGYGKVPQGPNALSLHPEDNPTFTVTGTPATRPHKPAGNLSDFSFTPTSVDTTSSPRHITVTARFKGADPTRVFAEFYTAKKSRHTHFFGLRVVLHDHHGTWSGTAKVPQWLGKQVLQAMLLADYGRNYRPSARSYSAAKLHQLNFPSKLHVISGIDTTKPTLKSVTFSPSPIDSTDGAERVTVTAKATDTGSGVRYIDVNAGIRHGINGVADGLYPHASAGVGFLSEDNIHVRLKKAANGTWVGTTTVRQCVPSGTYKVSVDLADHAGNSDYYSTKELAKAGITSTVDVTSKHGDIANPYVYSAATYGPESKLFLNFSEGVKNVSTSTLTVYPLSPVKTRYTKTAAVTQMTCSNGTDTIDCSGSGGLITSAVLVIPSLEPGKKYTVFANLNQVTPQLTDGNENPMQWNRIGTEVIDS